MKTVLYIVKNTYPTILKNFPILFLMKLIFYLVDGVTPLIQLSITTKMINSVSEVLTNKNIIKPLLTILALQVLFSLIITIISSLSNLVRTKIDNKVSFLVDSAFIEKVQKLSFSNFEDPEFFNDFERISNGAGKKAFEVIDLILLIIKNSITLTLLIFVLMKIHFILIFTLVLIFIPVLIQNLKIGKREYNLSMSLIPTERKMEYFYSILKDKPVIKEIKIFNQSRYLIDKWEKLFWVFSNQKYNLQIKTEFINLLLYGMNIVINLLILSITVFSSILGRLTIGGFVAVSQAVTSSSNQVRELATSISKISQTARYAMDYYSFLNLKEETRASDVQLNEPISCIEVKNLNFKYPNNENYTLQNICFNIYGGKKIAIVGENGAGKSTLAKCLAGLYEIPEGDINYNNISINEIDKYSLRSNITTLFQDFIKYNMTLRENLSFGNISKIDDDLFLEKTLNRLRLNKSDKQMDLHLDAMLGAYFEKGRDLSGGQWQKVALGRCLISEANLLILDEPTSAIDPIMEMEIIKDILSITDSKTAIIVTHRLACCRFVDEIIVLENGKLIEQGDHDSLLRKNGKYAEMFNSQLSMYKDNNDEEFRSLPLSVGSI
ncbi:MULTISPECIES: ABC transporter ATP-binding protein [Paenibacillus]|uniref:ABC transporter ATP-binding protein n=1 Tax=Paenibacillus odorifer TaxID=189426 RepID=A0A1R0XEF0_9BACL|nr:MULTISPECIES: ABC transporter ATP-binding protein [Paenibacillus]ETT50647.1 ABC transporter [Paenibacillus sp. FSL H8-237]OMD16877.1 hypothetical protein BJP47_19365 [Paenibacillus odorifer]OMD33449.1 hypothetical protein BJP51_11670 [Paenibacillus odorifer]OME25366.1 hypothetical protein BSK57_12220 [Paenibacillus odorifer]OME31139.1 hypothetical protein BSK63_15860 [Paenibacillus odorifer]